MRIPSKVSIAGTPPKCIVKVNGEPIVVTSVDLHLDCESLPIATIALPVIDGLDVETEADIAVDERTRQTLLRLGWTPPAEDGAKPEMSDEEFSRRLRKWARINPQEWHSEIERLARRSAAISPPRIN